MGITLISSSKFKVFFPSPFIHSNTIKSVSFFSSVFLSTQLLFKSNFLVHIFFLSTESCRRLFLEGVEEVRVTG